MIRGHVYPFDTVDHAEVPAEQCLRLATTSAKESQVGGNHYMMPIQPVEFIAKNNIDFFAGNIIKYAVRHRQKNGAQDIRKIIHYCQLILELEYGEKP